MNLTFRLLCICPWPGFRTCMVLRVADFVDGAVRGKPCYLYANVQLATCRYDVSQVRAYVDWISSYPRDGARPAQRGSKTTLSLRRDRSLYVVVLITLCPLGEPHVSSASKNVVPTRVLNSPQDKDNACYHA